MKSIWLCLLVMLAMIVNTSCTTLRDNPVVRPLLIGVTSGYMHCLRAKNYFDRDADVELAKAVAGRNTEKMERCLAKGADVNAVGREGVTPLWWSVYKNSKSGFVFLLQHGADPNLITKIYNGDEVSVMQKITTMRETDYLRLALENGVSPDSPFGTGRFKETLLFRAIMFSNLENVRVLVEAGANVNYQNPGNGETPVIQAYEVCNYDMVNYLLSAGADPKVKDISGYDLAKMIKLFGFTGGSKKDRQYYLMMLEKLGIREDEVWKLGQPRESFFIPQKFENGVWVGHE